MILKCSDCGLEKDEEDFPRHRKAAGDGRAGRHYKCKPCYAIYFAEYRKAKPEMFKKNQRNGVIRQKGIEPAEYDRLYELQGGRCAACQGPPQGKGLVIDHDHACCPGSKACGKCVRGLLCTSCNVALGHVENREKVAMLENYLSQCKGSLIDPTKGWT